MNPGVTVAKVLAGSWRAEPPPPDFGVAELESVERQLMASGDAGLAWWHIRNAPPLATSPTGERLHEAFRMHTLHAKLHEEQLVRVISAMDAAGLDPLLLKGWDTAGLYPERGLRPYGDIDLVALAAQRAAVMAALPGPGDVGEVEVLLASDAEFTTTSIEDLFTASHHSPLGRAAVRVMCPEDRLRTHAIHFLKHGGWRPLSLCDVAVASESRDTTFDWARCMTPDARVAGWVRAALALAGRLLGADLAGVPAEPDPPRWLVRSVLGRWARPWPGEHNAVKQPLPSLWHPAAVGRGLGTRWIDPVSATIERRRPLGRVKPVHLQLACEASRTLRYLATQGERR